MSSDPLAAPPRLEIDYESDAGRGACKDPSLRRHEDYQQPRWATCHIRGVDNLFAAAATDDETPQVRIDIDGVGAGMASLHDRDENINLSVWISRDQVDELIDALDAAREDGRNRWWPPRTDWSEGDE